VDGKLLEEHRAPRTEAKPSEQSSAYEQACRTPQQQPEEVRAFGGEQRVGPHE
jgi:hypothetical protein